MDNQFRNAAFGGFNRQDVVNYLERSAREHAQAQEQLRGELDAAVRERDDLRQQMQVLSAELDDLRALTEKNAEEAGQLPLLRQENDRLKEQVSSLEPDAAAYTGIKERTASIELEAHRRAQAIVDEAQMQAEQVRQELGRWLEHVERDYYDLRGQVGTTVTQASSELERVRQGLDNISLCMNNQHSALERLMQTAKNHPNE